MSLSAMSLGPTADHPPLSIVLPEFTRVCAETVPILCWFPGAA
jgi:hypothetical protein